MSTENDSQNNGRRDFLKKTGLGLLLAVPAAMIADQILTGGTPAQAADAPMVAETDPQAKALGYYTDATKVDTKKWAKRGGPGGDKQFCYSCMFYKASGDPKTAKSAPCTLFAGKQVQSKGWCNSWTQKPAEKV
jgi:hypothetical protein